MRACFIVSPFGQPGTDIRRWSDTVYEHIIRPVAAEKGYHAFRTLEQPRPGDITGQIAQEIAKADLVIVDLTVLNPNVMYELALRHSIGKPFIHLSNDTTQIPFDILQMNAIQIGTDVAVVESAKAALREQISFIESGQADFSTHASRYFSSQRHMSGKAYMWEITYSAALPSDWLDQQPQSFKEAAAKFMEDTGGIPNNPNHRRLLAEYLAYKTVPGTVARGDLYYHYTKREAGMVSGYGILRFPGNSQPILIEITGHEKRNGTLVIQFDQPARRVTIAPGIDEEISSFVYEIPFKPDDTHETFSGQLMHPKTNPSVKVGDSKLELRC